MMSRKFLVVSCLLVASVSGRRVVSSSVPQAAMLSRGSSKQDKATSDEYAGRVGPDASTPRSTPTEHARSFDVDPNIQALDVFTRNERVAGVKNAALVAVSFIAVIFSAMLVSNIFDQRTDFQTAGDILGTGKGFVNASDLSALSGDGAKVERLFYKKRHEQLVSTIARKIKHGAFGAGDGFVACNAKDLPTQDSFFCMNRVANNLIGMVGGILHLIMFVVMRNWPASKCSDESCSNISNGTEEDTAAVSARTTGTVTRRRAAVKDTEMISLLSSESEYATEQSSGFLQKNRKVLADIAVVAMSGLMFQLMQMPIHSTSRQITKATGEYFDVSSHMGQFLQLLTQISLTATAVDSTAARRFLAVLGGSHFLQGMLTVLGHYHGNLETLYGLGFGAVLAAGNVALYTGVHHAVRGERRAADVEEISADVEKS